MKFYSDGTCGDIVKWLRILGFDTSADYKNPAKVALKNSMNEERIFITRSDMLCESHYENIVKIPRGTFEGLNFLKERGLLNNIKPFTRCLVCNSELKNVDYSYVKDRVPQYVYKTYSEFKICPTCDRIYWQGTHIENMIRILKNASIL